ncbi:MAG TPA: hypothetical protein VNJ08_04810 [Bacteriovoracaceae bacterium]|nr:hypothetical protein [Bacteriovoracaceae bacterium]
MKILMEAFTVIKKKLGVTFYGVKYKSFSIFARTFSYSFTTDEGDKIQNKGIYTMAFPSEVGWALKEQLPIMAKVLFPSLKNTGKYYWDVMEDYIRENSPIRCM